MGRYGPGCNGTNGHEAPAPPARRRQTRGTTPRQTSGRADTVRCSASHAVARDHPSVARQQLRRLRRGARMQVHRCVWGHPRRLRHGKGLPPGVKKQNKKPKGEGGWETKVHYPRHGTRSRLATPGNPTPPTGDPQRGGGHGSPASTPGAEPKAVEVSVRTFNNQGGEIHRPGST